MNTNNESPAALLPCPWCGCTPASIGTPSGWDVSCENEECPATVSAVAFSKAAAEYAWNRRAPTAPVASESRGSVPEGFVLVPKVALERLLRTPVSSAPEYAQLSKLLAAAPTPPAVSNGEPPDLAIAQRNALRRLVDAVWNAATDSQEVPSMPWSDELIDSVFGHELARSAAAKGEG